MPLSLSSWPLCLRGLELLEATSGTRDKDCLQIHTHTQFPELAVASLIAILPLPFLMCCTTLRHYPGRNRCPCPLHAKVIKKWDVLEQIPLARVLKEDVRSPWEASTNCRLLLRIRSVGQPTLQRWLRRSLVLVNLGHHKPLFDSCSHRFPSQLFAKTSGLARQGSPVPTRMARSSMQFSNIVYLLSLAFVQGSGQLGAPCGGCVLRALDPAVASC